MLLRTGKAGKYCGLHKNTIRKYIDLGIIKGIWINGYRYVDTAELDKLIKYGAPKRRSDM